MMNDLVCFYTEKLIKSPFHAVYEFNLLWTVKQSKEEFRDTGKDDFC